MNMKKVLVGVTALSMLGFLAAPTVAFALPTGFTTVTNFEGTQGGVDVLAAIRNVVNALLALAAIIAAIFIIIGGVQYITSAGDEDAAATAKNTLIYALLGVVVIILSAVLVNFIITAVQA